MSNEMFAIVIFGDCAILATALIAFGKLLSDWLWARQQKRSLQNDHFRPHFDPSQTIYDALICEAEHRQDRTPEEWLEAEKQAVWNRACGYAKQHGLQPPTREDVDRVDQQACGHVDYAAKLAYGLAETMSPYKRTARN